MIKHEKCKVSKGIRGGDKMRNIQSPKKGNFQTGIKSEIFKVPKGEFSDWDKI